MCEVVPPNWFYYTNSTYLLYWICRRSSCAIICFKMVPDRWRTWKSEISKFREDVECRPAKKKETEAISSIIKAGLHKRKRKVKLFNWVLIVIYSNRGFTCYCTNFTAYNNLKVVTKQLFLISKWRWQNNEEINRFQMDLFISMSVYLR